jgi:drug/metabolite transporter (DMT)-like permease
VIRQLRHAHVPETVRWGVGLALVTAAISGVSIFVNGLAVRQLPDPAVYTTLKNGVAAVLLLAVASLSIPPTALRAVRPREWGWLVVIAVIGGSVPFVLFFTGLAQASAPSAAFIQKTLFIWVALLAVPLLGERLGLLPIAALGVLLAGQILVIQPAGIRWGTGETMIAAATLLWAIETIVVRRVVRSVPTLLVGTARLGLGLVVLIGYLAVAGKLGMIGALQPPQWAWALATGLLLAAYVATWFAALRRAPASAVTAILVLGAPVTAALAAIQSGTLTLNPPLLGQAIVVLGVTVVAAAAIRHARQRAAGTSAPLGARG